MANGKPHDHPLTDILMYDHDVYGVEVDELIRRIDKLCSRRELYEWWEREIDGSPDRAGILAKAQTRYQEVLKRAREGGWEVPK